MLYNVEFIGMASTPMLSLIFLHYKKEIIFVNILLAYNKNMFLVIYQDNRQNKMPTVLDRRKESMLLVL